jgi:negative regulator of flagellin synthesis FlgM
MVNPISPSGAPRLRPASEPDGASVKPSVAQPARPGTGGTVNAADSVSLSPGASTMPEALRGGPPIDRGLVDRISDAIANGRYPIDPSRIAEAIFRDVSDFAR